MTSATTDDRFARHWKEIASCFLKLGLIAYGGLALMGIMQIELQEKRNWVTRERYVEGLGLINMLPGAIAVQLGIFMGYVRGGFRGGVLAGLCVLLPSFFIMMALTVSYSTLGATPLMRGALYGLGPVVMAIFLIAVYRMGKASIGGMEQALIAVAVAAASASSALGTAAALLLAGGAGLFLFHSRRAGAIAVLALALLFTSLHFAFQEPAATAAAGGAGGLHAPGLLDLAAFFFKVGALTFGGGLTIIAFIHEQVVNQFHWLTPQEFIDGLALGQFTPGPFVMVAAYVGFKTAGYAGATIAAVAIFLPSFILMLSIFPVFDRMRQQAWIKAAMKGVSPAVIGVIAVALLHLAPHALSNAFALVIFACAAAALAAWRIGAVKLMVGGAIAGMLASQFLPLAGAAL